MLNHNDRSRWTVLALLFVSITINLLDRQVLSVMAVPIRDEFGLSNTQYSYIVFSFLLGATLAQVPAGLWLDRKGARYGLPAIMLLWSVANALHAIARGVWHFAAFRFLLGVGECGNYSAGVKVISQRFPPHERALAGGLFNSGTVIGALVAPALLVFLAAKFGWRMTFVLPSVLGLLWILPWLLLYRDPPTPAFRLAGARRFLAFARLAAGVGRRADARSRRAGGAFLLVLAAGVPEARTSLQHGDDRRLRRHPVSFRGSR